MNMEVDPNLLDDRGENPYPVDNGLEFWEVLVVAYVFITAIILVSSLIAYSVDGERDKQTARRIIFCWAWPVMAIHWVYFELRDIWEDAWS